jgi:hypothetical protein
MCVVSMVMDHYWDKWSPPPQLPTFPMVPPTITPEEVEEFRKLLERAREYDKKNNEPDCEIAEKRDRIKALADSLDVKIDFL